MSMAQDMDKHIARVIEYHWNHSKNAENKYRSWDKKTPYYIHPVWCAFTLLTETKLSERIRRHGALALLYHDILEDTNMQLPDGLPEEVVVLVNGMTYNAGFASERLAFNDMSGPIKLLKLYDKVSNMLDADWMDNDQYRTYYRFMRKLHDFVSSQYGELNIVRIARSIPSKRG